ncbi:MAG TPA: ATP-binding protein [Burkholderiaceae bacterium]|jgi:two-component system sensor histidine kinase PilS (NtrC family)
MSDTPLHDERRSRDRRDHRRSAFSDESWFGAFSSEDDTVLPDIGAAETARAPSAAAAGVDNTAYKSHFDHPPAPHASQDARAADDAPRGDPPFLRREATRMVQSGQTAFERLYRAFIAARAALGLALLLALLVAALFGQRANWVVSLVSLVYATASIGLWALPRLQPKAAPREMARLRSPQWLATIGLDLLCFILLHLLGPSTSLNYVALLVMPVLMAGVLTPRRLALATAAMITLALLAVAWWTLAGGSGDGALALAQAGLAGIGFFVITLLAGELASRLAREELTARGSLEMARQQAQLNRLVIEEMQDGVLVVDRRGRVRAANPAARRLLAPSGMSRPAPFQLRKVPAWEALVKTVERAFGEATWPEAGRDVPLLFEPLSANARGTQRTLRVRVRFTRKREPKATEEFCVLFLEDVRNMQARSRQEKLAAMGRVSAGIAHEIRNPLAAISQANALLAEDATDPAQRRLTRMVSDNVERLKRIVDDVMEVAPGVVLDVGVVDATALVRAVCGEWARAAGIEIGGQSPLHLDLAEESLGVLFDAEHLRRVLVNLLDNALRHASKQPGAVMLRLDSRHAGQAFLSVASDGPPIAPDVEPYLFEPFFSTRSRGTGLGLYICRELCERYGATIDYRLRAVGETQRNEFYVDMQRRALVAAPS